MRDLFGRYCSEDARFVDDDGDLEDDVYGYERNASRCVSEEETVNCEEYGEEEEEEMTMRTAYSESEDDGEFLAGKERCGSGRQYFDCKMEVNQSFTSVVDGVNENADNDIDKSNKNNKKYTDINTNIFNRRLIQDGVSERHIVLQDKRAIDDESRQHAKQTMLPTTTTGMTPSMNTARSTTAPHTRHNLCSPASNHVVTMSKNPPRVSSTTSITSTTRVHGQRFTKGQSRTGRYEKSSRVPEPESGRSSSSSSSSSDRRIMYRRRHMDGNAVSSGPARPTRPAKDVESTSNARSAKCVFVSEIRRAAYEAALCTVRAGPVDVNMDSDSDGDGGDGGGGDSDSGAIANDNHKIEDWSGFGGLVCAGNNHTEVEVEL